MLLEGECQTITIFLLLTPNIVYIIQQRKLIFWKKIYWSHNTVLLTLSRRTYNAFIAGGSTFGVLTPKLSDNAIKGLVWDSFAASVEL